LLAALLVKGDTVVTIHHLTLAQAATRIRSGDLSPVDLVEGLLEHLHKLEPSLQAWVTVDHDGVREAARHAESALREDRALGPLHGIPVGVKDIFYTAGLQTTACSKLFANFVPRYDATAVARLRRAGAIILGKTVTTELAARVPPPTRNPWDPACTPGATSSGSAVAVAARRCPAALGTQTGGSVVRPAAYNGVVGLVPTYGRISCYGVIPVAWTIDTVGFMTRAVEDAALLLQVLAGHDANDPASCDQPVPDYVKDMQDGATRPPHVGLVREPFFRLATPEVQEHTEQVVETLRRAGAAVEDVNLQEGFAVVRAAQTVVMRTEAAAYHQETLQSHPEAYSPMVRNTLERGLLISGVEYLQAQRHRRRFRRQLDVLLPRYDALLTPATPSTAPRDLANTGDPIFQAPWTLAGVPTMSLPTGLSREEMPLALQLVGTAFGESRLLAVARWCERVVGIELVPPVAR